MPPSTSTRRRVRQQDAGALVRVLAALQVHLLSGDLSPVVVTSLSRHLAGAGLLPAGATPAELLLALDDLNQRLRYSLGEYDHEPAGGTGESRHFVGFAQEAQATAFRAALAEAGDEVTGPEPVTDRAWDGDIGWQVTVRITDLPMSPAFDARIARLHESADRFTGHLGGWEA